MPVVQLRVTVASPAAGRRADVLIDAAAETAVAQVAAELDRLMHAGPGSRFPALFVGGHRVPGDMRLADAPILDGCVVSLGDPAGCPPSEPAGVAELRVAAGPGAGAVYGLGFGTADIGGGDPGGALVAGSADIVIDDPGIPPLALRVIIGYGGGQVAPYDGVPVLLDGQPLDQAAYWRPGQQVAIGDTLLDLVPYQPPDAALRPAEDGAGLLLRVGTADLPSEVELTDPTQDEHRRRRFWLIPDAPVTIPLAERGVAGIAGREEVPRSAWPVAGGPGRRPAQPRRRPGLRAHWRQRAGFLGMGAVAAPLPPGRGAELRRADRQRRRDGGGPDRRARRDRQGPAPGDARARPGPVRPGHRGGLRRLPQASRPSPARGSRRCRARCCCATCPASAGHRSRGTRRSRSASSTCPAASGSSPRRSAWTPPAT